MSNQGEDRSQCETFQDELTELALGILSGRQRSEVLVHVESCRWCSAELEQLLTVADTVLQLAPEAEPPLGFELRLAQKLQGAIPSSRKGLFGRVSALTAAAVLIVALGIGIGAIATSHSGNSPTGPVGANLTSASLSKRGQVLGEVFISGDKPAWMYMTIDGGSWSGLVKCRLTLAGGKVETIGTFKLTGGYGAWGAPLNAPASAVRSAQLVAANGIVLANARLST